MPRLTVAAIRAAKHPGSVTVTGKVRPIRLPDGEGLYLQLVQTGAKTWLYRYTLREKAREMGLGSVAVTSAEEQAGGITLAAARDLARQAKALLRQGIDPIDAREAGRKASEAASPANTFRHVTDLYIAAHRGATWRSERFVGQWKQTLVAYAFPHMADLPLAKIGTGEVMAALEPIWRSKPETAARVRGRIEQVLDYGKVRGWRDGENPARWRGHIDKLLPARSNVAKVQHHAALPWMEVGAFLAELRQRESAAARVLELQALTAARSGEAFGMRWGEVDMNSALWTVPAARMKAGKEHRVPLSGPALALLRGMLPDPDATPAPDAFVFQGPRPKKGLSNMAILRLLDRMNPETAEKPARWRDPRTGHAITPHGFRSCFRDWVAERTNYPRELAEAALAHTLGNKVEAAYQRNDMLEKRRRLMEDWARFCAKPMQQAEVVPLRAVAG